MCQLQGFRLLHSQDGGVVRLSAHMGQDGVLFREEGPNGELDITIDGKLILIQEHGEGEYASIDINDDGSVDVVDQSNNVIARANGAIVINGTTTYVLVVRPSGHTITVDRDGIYRVSASFGDGSPVSTKAIYGDDSIFMSRDKVAYTLDREHLFVSVRLCDQSGIALITLQSTLTGEDATLLATQNGGFIPADGSAQIELGLGDVNVYVNGSRLTVSRSSASSGSCGDINMRYDGESLLHVILDEQQP